MDEEMTPEFVGLEKLLGLKGVSSDRAVNRFANRQRIEQVSQWIGKIFEKRTFQALADLRSEAGPEADELCSVAVLGFAIGNCNWCP